MPAFRNSHHVFAPLLLVPSLAFGTDLESFEQSGSEWIGTLFPVVIGNHGALGLMRFVREPLASGLGAPDTTPPLPINVGGDKEARYFHDSPFYALNTVVSERLYSDVELDGYVAIGYPAEFGSRVAGFYLRAGGTPWPTAYFVDVVHNFGTTAQLEIAFMCNGLITTQTSLVVSQGFTIDPMHENYRVTARVQGTQISARIRRVFVSNGVIVEEPIDLLPAPGVQDELFATSTQLFEGSVGLFGFAPSPSSVFFDDVRITDLGGGSGTAYCSGDGGTLPCPCANDARPPEGCKNSNGVGARIFAVGSSSVAANDLRLSATQLPANTMALFFAGTTANLASFGDGLRCVGGAIVRLGAQTVSCGAVSRTNVVPSLGVTSGATRYFQAWYRNPNGPCGTGFNLSNGLELTFSP